MSSEAATPVLSVPTRGRTLDWSAPVYDLLEPLCLLGRQAELDRVLLDALDIGPAHAVLDIGCGTGLLCARIAGRLDPAQGGRVTGVDAAGRMIARARQRRGSPACRFEAMAAERLDFPDASFDAVASSLFYHHVPLDLKLASLREAFRVLKPGGRLVVADMHRPWTAMGALVSHASRWLLLQPQIGENIRGVLPGLMAGAGFPEPRVVGRFLGYIAVFATARPA